MKWCSQRDNTISCSSSPNVHITSSNIVSSSALSAMLRTGASVPLLALHRSGSHDISIFIFVALICCCCSSSSSSLLISFACLIKNAAPKRTIYITNFDSIYVFSILLVSFLLKLLIISRLDSQIISFGF